MLNGVSTFGRKGIAGVINCPMDDLAASRSDRIRADAGFAAGERVAGAVQHAILGPAIHACINAMPTAKSWRKTAPFAALLGNIQNCVEHGEVLKLHIPALNRQAILDLFVLLGRDFH